jgi:DNA-binding MarR family transcriptional regulator
MIDEANLEAVRVLARLTRIVERGTAELSLAHYRVLAAVADGDERASRVAARLALGKPTISASVDALCRRGLLTREDVAGDHRAMTLRLTPQGESALQEVETTLVERLGIVLSHTADPDSVRSTLGQLGVALDAVADERIASLRSSR